VNKSKYAIVLLSTPVVSIANVGYDALGRDDPDSNGGSDWLSFLMVLFVVLMVLGKIK
jgi:hypothetical protein